MTNKQPHFRFSLIKIVVDKYFDFMEELGGNASTTSVIPASMIDNTRPPDNDWSYWNALPSTVTDEEINKLESYFKHKLPDSYKFFLQQRHFIELQLGQRQLNFFYNLAMNFCLKQKRPLQIYIGIFPNVITCPLHMLPIMECFVLMQISKLEIMIIR
jgi:hypothetical protein